MSLRMRAHGVGIAQDERRRQTGTQSRGCDRHRNQPPAPMTRRPLRRRRLATGRRRLSVCASQTRAGNQRPRSACDATAIRRMVTVRQTGPIRRRTRRREDHHCGLGRARGRGR